MAIAIAQEATRELVCDLIKVLGFDPKRTRDITIHLPAMDVITVTVEQFVEGGELETVVKALTARAEVFPKDWNDPK